MKVAACELCESDGGEILFRHDDYRIVRVTGAEGNIYRGFCRVIWNHHVKEMSDLTDEQRNTLMVAVFRLEAALRTALTPDKINLASLGNMTPHVHWHVIPRFRNDETFPQPIWAAIKSAPAEPDLIPVSSLENQSSGFNVDWIPDVRRALMDGELVQPHTNGTITANCNS